LSSVQERASANGSLRSDRLRVSRTLVSRFSFARPAAIRYLRARARTQPVEKKNSTSRRSRGRIPRARITRRGYLPSISSLGKKIVLRLLLWLDYGAKKRQRAIAR